MSLFLAVGTMWADVNAELTSKYVIVGDDATELTVGTWYALYNHGRGCYVSQETDAFRMRNAAIEKGTAAEDVAGKLFKLTAAETDGQYYLTSGNGYSLNAEVSSTAEAYKIVPIGDNAGHFCIQRAKDNATADGNANAGTFVFYGTGVPNNVGGNNCYHFKPVTLAESRVEFNIVYKYMYENQEKYSETQKVYALDQEYPDYPACTVALPRGVTAAAKPEGKVTVHIPHQEPKVSDDVGEYVDFKEE